MSLPYSKTKAVLPLTFIDEPTVFFTVSALAKVQYIVASCGTELAWLGLVDELENGDFLITDIYIPEQEVSSATAEIDAEAIAKLAYNHDIDSAKLRYHGHSHVNMEVIPSSTDQHHIEDYLEHFPFLIRTISNKKGEMRVDLFDKRSGFTYQNIGYQIWEMAFTDQELENINKELKNVKTRQPKPLRTTNTDSSIKWHEDNEVVKSSFLPSAVDILEYFSNMSHEEMDAELKLLTSEERKNISAMLQDAGFVR